MSLTPPQGRSWVVGGHSTSSGAWSDMVRVRVQGEKESRETRAESCAFARSFKSRLCVGSSCISLRNQRRR